MIYTGCAPHNDILKNFTVNKKLIRQSPQNQRALLNKKCSPYGMVFLRSADSANFIVPGMHYGDRSFYADTWNYLQRHVDLNDTVIYSKSNSKIYLFNQPVQSMLTCLSLLGTNSKNVARISIRSEGQNEAGKIAEQGRPFANPQTERLVSKDGTCNILSKNVPMEHRSNWSRDIFTTLLDLRWRYIILVFAAVLVGSWFFFAILWWAISVLHGDHLAFNNVIEENNSLNNTLDVGGLPISNISRMSQNRSEPFNSTSSGTFEIKELLDSGLPCVYGVHNFITALLFSVETQQTIGYGTRYITSNCIYGIVLLVAQSCTGMVLFALTTGIIHSKACKPKRRAHTMMFSRFAVICLRDDEYCLLFRVGDMRRSYLIGTSIRAIVMKAKQGDEKLNPLSQQTLELESDVKDTSPILIWPVTMVHRINESSPLWHMSPEDLILAKFEIIVVLEGTIEHTGMTAQFRTSYLPSEILWGNHLAPLLTHQKQNGKYEIDFTLFHNVTPINMPKCSAEVYARVKHSENRVVGSNPTGFATGGFKRILSRNARKKMKPKDDQLNSPEISGNKSLQWKFPSNPNFTINRLYVNAARNFFKSRRERIIGSKSLHLKLPDNPYLPMNSLSVKAARNLFKRCLSYNSRKTRPENVTGYKLISWNK